MKYTPNAQGKHKNHAYYCKCSQCRYRPAKSTVSTKKPNNRYLKLYTGDIYDRQTDTVLDRDDMLKLLNVVFRA